MSSALKSVSVWHLSSWLRCFPAAAHARIRRPRQPNVCEACFTCVLGPDSFRTSGSVRCVTHWTCHTYTYPRWTDVSDQYLIFLFRGFAISFGRDPSVSSLTIPTVIHNLINQSINQPIGIQSSLVPIGLGHAPPPEPAKEGKIEAPSVGPPFWAVIPTHPPLTSAAPGVYVLEGAAG